MERLAQASAQATSDERRAVNSNQFHFFLQEPDAPVVAAAANNRRQTFVPEDYVSTGPRQSQQERCACGRLLPFPFLQVVIMGVAEHGVQNEKGYQQVRQIDR